MKKIVPTVGRWYRLPGGAIFEVVAIDESDRTIEIQHYDGTVEEIERDAWTDMTLTRAEPPEDYSGSLDIEKEDYGLERDDEPHAAWADPLDYLDTKD